MGKYQQHATDIIVTSLLSIPGNSDTIEREHPADDPSNV
jgi:hypothetical protein